MNNYTNPGYDWKQDQEAIKKLGDAWKAAGMPGEFDINNPDAVAWAQQRYNTATASPGTLVSGQLHSTPTYQNAPVGGKDPSGNSIFSITNPDGSTTYTKEFYDEKLIPYLSKLADFGTQVSFKLDTNGNIVAIDNADGSILGTGEPSTVIGGSTGTYINPDGTYNAITAVKDFNDTSTDYDIDEPSMKQYLEYSKGVLPDQDTYRDWALTKKVWDFDSPEDIAQAVNFFEDDSMIDGITDSSMKQYLESHGGKLPKNDKQWEDWSVKDRIYETTGDDLTAALFNVSSIGGSNVSSDRVKQYLQDSGGKLPASVDQWNEWNDSTGNIKYVKDFLNGTNTGKMRVVDKKLLSDIRSAQDAVKAGTATDKEKELAESVGPINSLEDSYEINSTGSRETNNFHPWSAHGESWATFSEYNTNIYHNSTEGDESSNSEHLKFNDEKRAELENLAGQVIYINGKYYRVDPDKPVVDDYKYSTLSNMDVAKKYKRDFYADGLNLIALDGGENMVYTYDAKGRFKMNSKDGKEELLS
jgi:hypothetical protein